MLNRMPNASINKQSGFALIELLVVVGIMIIIVGGSIAGFVTFRDRQQVVSSAKSLQQLLRTAQTKARVRETPTDPSCNAINNRLQGYRVSVGSSTLFTLQPLCGPDSAIATPGSFVPLSSVETLTLTDATLTTSLSYIDFYTLHRGVKIKTNLGFATTQNLRLLGSTYAYCFDIDDSGTISDVIGCL
jgi:type II secretory pathway pseudopilin PulG